jgi:lysophospholipase L1-like esterase
MNSDQKTIVCVGDSTTSMEWCHPNWFDWLDFSLRQGDEINGWKTKLVNSGKDGATIPFFLDSFEFLIGRFKPDVVILSLGFNHLELEGNVEETLKELVLKIKSTGSKVVLWSTYKTINELVSKKLETIRDIYKKVSVELDLQFVDMYEEFGKYDLNKVFSYKYLWENIEWKMKPGDIDFLHCNLIGNQIIAEKLGREVFGIELLDYGDFGTMKKVDLKNYLKSDKELSTI